MAAPPTGLTASPKIARGDRDHLRLRLAVGVSTAARCPISCTARCHTGSLVPSATRTSPTAVDRLSGRNIQGVDAISVDQRAQHFAAPSAMSTKVSLQELPPDSPRNH